MIHTKFDYKAPKTINEAIEILSMGNAKIIAGGTSLLNVIRSKEISPDLLIDLKNLKELKGISVEKSSGIMKIHSMTTYSEIIDSPEINNFFPALTDAIQSINNPQWKNRTTLGGNIAFNNPNADITAVLLALYASIDVIGKDGKRNIPIDSFFISPFITDLNPNEIIVSINIPLPSPNDQSAYLKIKNQANQTAICGIAVLIGKNDDGIIDKCRIGITGATENVSRLINVEEALKGKKLTKENISLATEQIKNESLNYITDFVASSEYRANMSKILTERTIMKIAEMY